MSFKFDVPKTKVTPPKPEKSVQSDARSDIENAPDYDWRTDPYYAEDAIRERMKAAKAEHLPVSVMDRKVEETVNGSLTIS